MIVQILGCFPTPDFREDTMLRLRDIMTKDVITVTPDMSLRDTMELFSSHHISGAPVVQGGKVIGLISATDILEFASNAARAVAEPAPEPFPQDLPEPDDWEPDEVPETGYIAELWMRRDPEADDSPAPAVPRDPLDMYTVSDAMTHGIYGLAPDAPASAAAESMRAANVHRLLVMDDGKLVGIITTMDLVRAVADRKLVRRTYVFDRS
jgi:CBS domain-containing protein